MQDFVRGGVGAERWETFGDVSRHIPVTARRTVHLGNDHELPDDLAVYQGARIRELDTKGEGSCAVHACFGSGSTLSSARQIACRDPRELLAHCSPRDVKALMEQMKLEKQQDACRIMVGVWSDALRPFVKEGGEVADTDASQDG